MVVYDHEIFSSTGRSDRETPGLIGTDFSCELYRLQVRHFFRTLSYCEGRGGVVITGGLEMVVSGEVFLVDLTFFRSWRRCPFAVAMILGKCF